MAKVIRIDECGAYCTSDDIFGGNDDWDDEDERHGLGRTEDEYIIPSDALLEGE